MSFSTWTLWQAIKTSEELKMAAYDLDGPRNPAAPTSSSRAQTDSRSPFRDKGWSVSTHFFPASTLRSYHAFPPSSAATSDSAATDANLATAPTRRQSPAELKAAVRALFALRGAESPGVSLPDGATPPLIAVNRYYKADDTRKASGSTIITCHAAGLHKETWEPTLSVMVDRMSDCCEIWSLDAFSHGESRGAEGGLVTADWVDLARDVETFIRFYLPAKRLTPPPYLERHYGSFIRPRLIGIGHSFGAATLAHSATLLPQPTFSSLILIEPAMFSSATVDLKEIRQTFPWLSMAALAKRQVWSEGRPSVAQLKSGERGMYGKWNDEVARIFCEFGIEGAGKPFEARLKMRGDDEALLFARPADSSIAFSLLPRLSPTVDILVLYGRDSIIPADGTSAMPRTELRRALGHCRTTEVTLEDLGHLLVQESPAVVGAQLAKWLAGARGGARL